MKSHITFYQQNNVMNILIQDDTDKSNTIVNATMTLDDFAKAINGQPHSNINIQFSHKPKREYIYIAVTTESNYAENTTVQQYIQDGWTIDNIDTINGINVVTLYKDN